MLITLVESSLVLDLMDMAGLDLDIVAADDFILVDRIQLERDFGKMNAFYFLHVLILCF